MIIIFFFESVNVLFFSENACVYVIILLAVYLFLKKRTELMKAAEASHCGTRGDKGV
jgi:hypothetical protein